jgi:DNA-binding CsgD family transcriptional regulator
MTGALFLPPSQQGEQMMSDRAGGLKRQSGVVLIGQTPQFRRRIASVLRAAGFRIEASVPDADLAFLQAVASGHQTVSIFEVNDGLEERTNLSYASALPLMGQFRRGKAQQAIRKNLKPKKRPPSGRVRNSADGISENAASSRAATSVAAARERDPTHRQAMILKSLVNGDSNKAVARKLHIAEATVKVHMKLLLRRIGVKNRTQAAIWAVNNHFAPEINETQDVRPAPPPTEPRSARRFSATKTVFGAPTERELARSRSAVAKGIGKTAPKCTVNHEALFFGDHIDAFARYK